MNQTKELARDSLSMESMIKEQQIMCIKINRGIKHITFRQKDKDIDITVYRLKIKPKNEGDKEDNIEG